MLRKGVNVDISRLSTAVELLCSGLLLLYTAIIAPVQICMWNYEDPCHIFPTMYFDVFVDAFFLVKTRAIDQYFTPTSASHSPEGPPFPSLSIPYVFPRLAPRSVLSPSATREKYVGAFYEIERMMRPKKERRKLGHTTFLSPSGENFFLGRGRKKEMEELLGGFISSRIIRLLRARLRGSWRLS
jgi:hypothetical protein